MIIRTLQYKVRCAVPFTSGSYILQQWVDSVYRTAIKQFPNHHHTHPDKQNLPDIVLLCSLNKSPFVLRVSLVSLYLSEDRFPTYYSTTVLHFVMETCIMAINASFFSLLAPIKREIIHCRDNEHRGYAIVRLSPVMEAVGVTSITPTKGRRLWEFSNFICSHQVHQPHKSPIMACINQYFQSIKNLATCL